MKFFNPMDRSYLRPKDDLQNETVNKTNYTMRTIGDNENSFNPFNKYGVRDVFEVNSAM